MHYKIVRKFGSTAFAISVAVLVGFMAEGSPHETNVESTAETPANHPVAAPKEKPVVLRVEAFPGTPFGIAKVTFRMGQQGKLVQNTGAVRISERDGRVFYPTFSEGLLSAVFDRPVVGGVQSVWFLFRGEEKLNVTLHGADSETFEIEMPRRPRPAMHRLLTQAWWRQFNTQARNSILEGDYPPLVETYLTSMLSRRLDLSAPIVDSIAERKDNQLKQTISLLFDVESIRAESIRQLMNQPPGADLATLPVPQNNFWPASPVTIGEAPPTEPIANFVPEECFYLRFGTWHNQLWLKRLLGEYGGDLSRMVALRGHQSGDTNKMLDQLVLESGQIDDWFGGNLIEDVAAIGTDLYVEDGPSNAILLLAKNDSLEDRIRKRRMKYAKQNEKKGVTLREIDIAGNKVTLLSTEDNQIRSFYAVKDLCHITSSSRTIMERFFEAAEGNRSLAKHAGFQEARRTLPLDRDDTVFIYLSRPFFENLLSPQYQIELARRNRSLANIQLLQLAQWAAKNEGFADDDIDGMIAHGLLPEKFNQLPDGSFSTWVNDHWHDSVRGRRGYFIPIADTKVESITPGESAWLNARIEFYKQELKTIDPLLIGFKRFELSNEVERVVIDARLAPFGKEKYGWIGNLLGPPLHQQIAAGPNDLISIQASIAGNMFTRTDEPHQLFAVVQGDVPPKTDLNRTGFLELLDLYKTTPGYIGAWPSPGYLDRLPALGARPDAEGYTYSRLLDVWRLQQDDMSLISFDRNRLEAVRDQIRVEPAKRPAQVRLRVGDIANSNLREWANSLYYQRALETSVANVRLLNLVIQQFNLPQETVLAQTEQLLGVSLVCPLQGEYSVTPTIDGRSVWQSNQWPSFEDATVPIDYVAPPMNWLRGMSLDVYQRQAQFVVHGSLDIARDPSKIGSGGSSILENLPSIDVFKGFSKVEELPAPLEENDARKPEKNIPNDGELKAPKRDR